MPISKTNSDKYFVAFLENEYFDEVIILVALWFSKYKLTKLFANNKIYFFLFFEG